MDKKPLRWTTHDDHLFRELVDAGAAPDAIAEVLNRTVDELKRRGYVLGLPLKWFRDRTV
jgi:hypothetical protein